MHAGDRDSLTETARMTDQPQKNVRQYRREQLEPEIAAMSVEIEESENPIVIVNIDDPAAKGAIKKVIVWLGTITGIGWIVEWLQRSVRHQIVLAVAGTATVAITATAVVVTDIVREKPRPPTTAQHVITLPPPPPVTVTAPTTQPTTPPSTAEPERSMPPAEGREQPRPASTPQPIPESTRHSPRPAPTRSAKPTTTATNSRSSAPTAASSKRPAPDVDPPPTSAAPMATTDPPPQPSPEPEPEPTVAAADCQGLAQIDLDPLLDLCLLG